MKMRVAVYVTSVLFIVVFAALYITACAPVVAEDDYPCRWEKASAGGGFTPAWRLRCKFSGIESTLCYGVLGRNGVALSCP